MVPEGGVRGGAEAVGPAKPIPVGGEQARAAQGGGEKGKPGCVHCNWGWVGGSDAGWTREIIPEIRPQCPAELWPEGRGGVGVTKVGGEFVA